MEQNLTTVTLTPAEKLLASRIQFDEQVLRVVKNMIGRDIEPYDKGVLNINGYVHEYVHSADIETEGKGFTVKLTGAYDNTWVVDKWPLDVLYKLREILPAGYQVFLTDFNCSPEMTILKTNDPYDIIRIQQTHGWDFEDKLYTSEDLIGVLAQWQQECRLNIIGADSDNIKLTMETLPDDLIAFAEKANFLCWELDQINGFGNYGEGEAENRSVAEKLAAHLRETRRLYLWWD